MDELAKFQERIKQNQAKLDEIDRRRNELKQEAKRRKEEEEREKIKAQEELNIRRKRLKSSLSPSKATFKTGTKVCSVRYIERDVTKEEKTSFKSIGQRSSMICLGTDNGKLNVLDVINSFKVVVSMDIKAETSIYALFNVVCDLNLPKTGKGGKSYQANGVEVLLVGAGCDIFLISTTNWSQLFCVDDAHENEIQQIVEVPTSTGGLSQVVVSGGLDQVIKGWNTSTWANLFVLNGHSDAILSLVHFPRPNRLISGSDDSTIRVWDVDDCVMKARKHLLDSKKALEEKKDATEDELLLKPIQISEEEHKLTEHSDFVYALCVTTAEKSVSGNTVPHLLVSAAGDFSIRVWDSTWKCIRVLDPDKFVIHLAFVSGKLLATTRTGMEQLDECSLEMWNAVDIDPVTWVPKTESIKLMQPSCLLVAAVDPAKFRKESSTSSSGPKRTGILIVTTGEDEHILQVWNCPFPIAKPKPTQGNKSDTPTVVAPATTSSSSGGGVVAPASAAVEDNMSSVVRVGPKVQVGEYPGDNIAKKLITTILELDKLSPDMTRLLNVCTNLHQK